MGATRKQVGVPSADPNWGKIALSDWKDLMDTIKHNSNRIDHDLVQEVVGEKPVRKKEQVNQASRLMEEGKVEMTVVLKACH